MSRRSLTETIRSAVAALRGALSELEADSGTEWELVDSPRGLVVENSGVEPGRPSASSALPLQGAPFIPEPAGLSLVSSQPRDGDPLPNEALFLVSSLHREDRVARATRAWQAGLQAGAILRGERNYPNSTPFLAVRNRVYVCLLCRGDRTVRYFTSFGRFKLHVGALERTDTVCHGFPTEGECRVYVRAAGGRFPRQLRMELITEFLAAPADAGCLVLEAPALSSRPMVFVPLLRRTDGILAAVPIGALADAMVDAGQTGGLDLTVGPSCQVSAGLAEEDDEGALQPTGKVSGFLGGGRPAPFQVRPSHLSFRGHSFSKWLASLDARPLGRSGCCQGVGRLPDRREDGILLCCRRAGCGDCRSTGAGAKTEGAGKSKASHQCATGRAVGFHAGTPACACPAPASDVPLPHRAAFPIGLAPHTQNPLGSLRGLVGPPPKVRAPVLQHPPPPLVAQDAPQEELGQDPITGDCRDELLCRRNAETEPGLGHIGVAFGSSGRRRRVFVGAGFRFPGSFLLQVSQQALRRLAPADQVPQTREDLLHRRPLFTAYAERFGGFGGQRSLGIVFWLLANIADTMLSGDHVGAEELLALSLIWSKQLRTTAPGTLASCCRCRRIRRISCSSIDLRVRIPACAPSGG